MEVGLTPPIILAPQDSFKRMSGYLKKSAKPLKLSSGPVTQEACFGVKSRELTPRIWPPKACCTERADTNDYALTHGCPVEKFEITGRPRPRSRSPTARSASGRRSRKSFRAPGTSGVGFIRPPTCWTKSPSRSRSTSGRPSRDLRRANPRGRRGVDRHVRGQNRATSTKRRSPVWRREVLRTWRMVVLSPGIRTLLRKAEGAGPSRPPEAPDPPRDFLCLHELS